MTQLGQRHLCPGCRKKFYDLGQVGAPCPICSGISPAPRLGTLARPAAIGSKADSLRDVRTVIKMAEQGVLPRDAIIWGRSALQTLEEIWDCRSAEGLSSNQGHAIRNIHIAARRWLERRPAAEIPQLTSLQATKSHVIPDNSGPIHNEPEPVQTPPTSSPMATEVLERAIEIVDAHRSRGESSRMELQKILTKEGFSGTTAADAINHSFARALTEQASKPLSIWRNHA